MNTHSWTMMIAAAGLVLGLSACGESSDDDGDGATGDTGGDDGGDDGDSGDSGGDDGGTGTGGGGTATGDDGGDDGGTDTGGTGDGGTDDGGTGGDEDPDYPRPEGDMCPETHANLGTFCAAPCSGPSNMCPKNGECVYNPDSSAEMCETNDDCPMADAGETCQMNAGGSMSCLLPPSHCVVFCMADGDCPTGMTCDTMAGFCGY